MFLTNLAPEVYRPWLAARGADQEMAEVPYTCFYVDTGSHRVLIDTGSGVRPDQPGSGQLLPRLREEGIDPQQIDLVILTHAHIDHVGGCLDASGRPVFARARHVVGDREWAYWTSNPSLEELPIDAGFRQVMAHAAVTALRGLEPLLDRIQPDEQLVPGITVVNAFGHSPGQLAVVIESGGERLIFAADAIVLPLHVEYPDTIGATDHRPQEMIATRRRLLAEAAQDGALVATSHFRFPGLGRVRPSGAGWTWEAAGMTGSST
jgi:glyoxylase-like metal-dependent hydrolase (beta-lactamase superfamily II)